MITANEDRDDLLYSLDTARENIFEPLKQQNDKMTAATSEAIDCLDSVLKQVQELQLQLDSAYNLSDELKNKYEERLMNRTQNQQESARNEELRRIEHDKITSLSAEVALCERQLDDLDNEPLVDSLTDHEQLQMALFRGMGIEMKVEEDSKVRKTILSSPNQQDIITFPIDNFSKEFTANYIWEFISKDL